MRINVNTPQIVKDAPRWSSGYATRHPKLSKWALALLPFLFYLLLSCIFFGPSNLSDLTKDIFNNSSDPQQFVWFYNWWPYSLTHHLNPFVTKFDWYPKGYNLTWATSIPSLALLATPITLVWGAVLTYNLVAILSPVLAATCCFYLLHYITKKYVPSLIGGYIFGFSTYEITELLGHPHLYVDFTIPLLVLLFLLRFNNRIGSALYIVVSVILLVFQFGISTEVLATLFIFSTLAFIVAHIFLIQSRVMLREVFLQFLMSAFFSMITLLPFLVYMAKGYSSIPSVLHPISAYSTNVANYFIPTPMTLIGGTSLTVISRHFTGTISETSGYIGLPFIIILIYIAIRHRGNRLIKVTVTMLLLVLLLTLGPKLHLIGRLGGIWLPWSIFSKLPLFRDALPDRFTVYAFLLIAIIIGLWLSMECNKRTLRMKHAFTLLGIIAILPNPMQYSWSKVDVPNIFTAEKVDQYIPRNTNIIILPFGNLGSSVYYQYTSGMSFTQTGGYVGATPVGYINNSVIQSFNTGTLEKSFNNDLKIFCKENHVEKIIYLPQTSPNLTKAIESLGWPATQTNGAIVVNVPTKYS